jgi:hypothetical protein
MHLLSWTTLLKGEVALDFLSKMICQKYEYTTGPLIRGRKQLQHTLDSHSPKYPTFKEIGHDKKAKKRLKVIWFDRPRVL